MLAATEPDDETLRLAALRSLALDDGPADERLDALTRTARRLFNVPTALIVLVDEHHVWVKSGQPLPARAATRNVSFCAHAILDTAALVVPDARVDPRFHDNPLVTDEPHIRFYAGHPLTLSNGLRIGTFCLFDTLSRDLDLKGRDLLQELADMAAGTMERNVLEAQLRAGERAMRESEQRMSLAIAGSGTGIWDRNVVTGHIDYSAGWKAILGYDGTELSSLIDDAYTRLHPDDLNYVQAAMHDHFEGRTESYAVEHRIRCKDGRYKWISSRGKVSDRDAEGRALRMIGTTTDITQLRQMSERLQDTVDLVTSLTNEVPGLVFQSRLLPSGESYLSYASAGIRDIYELTAADVAESDLPIRRLIHPDDIEAFDAALSASAKDLSPLHLEYRVILPRQGVRWRQGAARPRRLPDNSILWHGFITDITDRKHIESELQEFATVDFLTRLPNRRDFMRRIEEELGWVRSSGMTSTVLMCDLDYFKAINDEWGHAVGDLALKHFAALLRLELDPGDIVGRVGGEEFAVVLRGIDDIQATAFARRVRERIAGTPLIENDRPIALTVSIGIATMKSTDANADQPLSRSDLALYRAKKNGRNRVECY